MNERPATKSSADLRISESHKAALVKTLELLESGKLVHAQPAHWDNHTKPFVDQFNMAYWNDNFDCGTVCCIGGTAEIIGGVTFHDCQTEELFNLFNPDHECEMKDITPAQAAVALRSYLTVGEARWDLALNSVRGPS